MTAEYLEIIYSWVLGLRRGGINRSITMIVA